MRIRLTCGKFAVVDKQDVPLISGFTWRSYAFGKHFTRTYATAVKYINKKNRSFRMHRIIAGAKKGQIVDHVNGNGLDNRRCNLRFATPSQNLCNRHHKPVSGHGAFGIYHAPKMRKNGKYFYVRKKRWIVRMGTAGKVIELGHYRTRKEAIAARIAGEKRFPNRTATECIRSDRWSIG